MKHRDMSKCNQCRKNESGRCAETEWCIYGASGDSDNATDQFEQRLMKMAVAIFEAVSAGGGVVWKNGASEHELTITRDLDIDFYEEQYNMSNEISYFVRPLPPVTFGWNEALERLQRGEEVQYEIQDGACVVLHPIICATSKNGCMHGSTTMFFNSLTDKQFTAAE